MSHIEAGAGAGAGERASPAVEGAPQPIAGKVEPLSGVVRAARPATGDLAVDDVLRQLDAVTDQPLDTQIRVSEQVLRVMQDRLADLGKE